MNKIIRYTPPPEELVFTEEKNSYQIEGRRPCLCKVEHLGLFLIEPGKGGEEHLKLYTFEGEKRNTFHNRGMAVLMANRWYQRWKSGEGLDLGS